MKQVSKKEFYAAVGPMDVVVSIRAPKKYPYTSDFKTRAGVLVGYVKDLDRKDSEYFLNPERFKSLRTDS